MGLRAGAPFSVESLELHVRGHAYQAPQVPLSVLAQNSAITHRQQGHEACQRGLLWLTEPAWAVLHPRFTALCAGRLTLRGYAWLIWLAHHCLPTAAVTRLALQHPNMCMLPVGAIISGVYLLGRSWRQTAAESRVAVNSPKRL